MDLGVPRSSRGGGTTPSSADLPSRAPAASRGDGGSQAYPRRPVRLPHGPGTFVARLAAAQVRSVRPPFQIQRGSGTTNRGAEVQPVGVASAVLAAPAERSRRGGLPLHADRRVPQHRAAWKGPAPTRRGGPRALGPPGCGAGRRGARLRGQRHGRRWRLRSADGGYRDARDPPPRALRHVVWIRGCRGRGDAGGRSRRDGRTVA